MKIEQTAWTEAAGWAPAEPGGLGGDAHFVLAFGATDVLRATDRLAAVAQKYPNAYVLGCSTSGEICGTRVLDDSLVVTAVHFQHTTLKAAEVGLGDVEGGYDAGRTLARALAPEGLVHVLILSDGLKVNGSELVQGLVRHLPAGVAVTGGLSGDGARFGRTLVAGGRGDGAGTAAEGKVAAVGFYGDRLRVGYGSMGGWDSFGPECIVSRSEKNVLFELDGQSALALYKKYIGEQAAGLPASGLLFPLSVRTAGGEAVVRTILSVDESRQTMTFAGDIPQGCRARLMRANFERLIDGASRAARTSADAVSAPHPMDRRGVPSKTGAAELAVLISCVGRKLVLKQRVEDEVEAVREALGDKAVMTGFYSYGEISPFTAAARCELHNQTMTVTTFREV